MVAKPRRKIKSKTVRSMLNWFASAVLGFPQVEQLASHYRFKLVLKHQATKRGGVVLDVGESRK